MITRGTDARRVLKKFEISICPMNFLRTPPVRDIPWRVFKVYSLHWFELKAREILRHLARILKICIFQNVFWLFYILYVPASLTPVVHIWRINLHFFIQIFWKVNEIDSLRLKFKTRPFWRILKVIFLLLLLTRWGYTKYPHSLNTLLNVTSFLIKIMVAFSL